MKRTIKLTERELRQMISESVKRTLNEAENYGWVVEESEVYDAYEMAIDAYGKEKVDDAIVRTLEDRELASSLAYIFRMWDFEEWDEHKRKIEGEDDGEDEDEYEDGF